MFYEDLTSFCQNFSLLIAITQLQLTPPILRLLFQTLKWINLIEQGADYRPNVVH